MIERYPLLDALRRAADYIELGNQYEGRQGLTASTVNARDEYEKRGAEAPRIGVAVLQGKDSELILSRVLRFEISGCTKDDLDQWIATRCRKSTTASSGFTKLTPRNETSLQSV